MNYRNIVGLLTLLLSISATSPISGEVRRSDTIKLRSPLDIPLYLAGNFGELRRSHFHSGIDFKTQGRTGFPVHSVADGYVSRATVSPWGFGRAVYVTHPSSGITTVYGHLEAFSPEIDRRVRNLQYEKETFTIDVSFEPDEIPVKNGDIIGSSGNAGSSGGPHVHFDVRDTKTGNALDPLEYYRTRIKDDVKPEVRQVILFPAPGGTVEGKESIGSYRQPSGNLTFHAHGPVIPAIKAYDRMSGTQNIYGIKYLTLLLDSDTIYRRVIDESPFESTRAIHTLVNNRDLAKDNAWVMWTYIPPSAPLGKMVWAENRGILTVDSGKTYDMTWLLEDEHGNITRQPFKIIGDNQIAASPIASGQLMLWNCDNLLEDEKIIVEVPEGTLYDNEFIDLKRRKSPNYLSEVITVGDPAIATANSFELSIAIDNDTVVDKQKYCLVRINGSRRSAESATYSDGWLDARPSTFGTYAVTVDTVPPKIIPIVKERWKSTGVIKFKITDELSGIQSWRGEIDGKFALFELDGKTSTLSFKIDPERFPGKDHKVTLTVTDACGNIENY